MRLTWVLWGARARQDESYSVQECQHREKIVAACRVCEEHSRANPKESLVPMEFPDLSWVKVGANLFELNSHHNLIIVDCFSKWPDIHKLDNLTAKDIISSIKSQISRYGIPDKWSQTTDVGLLLLYLLNSWLAVTCNTQQPVLTIHKKTGKQKELYRLSNACWWRRQIHTKRCLTTETCSRRWTLSYTTISRSSVEDDAATTFKLLQPGQGSSKERHN